MNTEQLQEVYEHLAALAAENKNEEFREYLSTKLSELPEELQDEIVFGLFTNAVVTRGRELEAVEAIQEEALAAAKILKFVKG
ncbi:MAG TPA: hypothetical protein VMU27_01205, partial [Candidatus Paceibacterota bacterium]|nr:hypothetical protein [Candidatus Paceibacterota bacterium]